jgi:hypothetical protein
MRVDLVNFLGSGTSPSPGLLAEWRVGAILEAIAVRDARSGQLYLDTWARLADSTQAPVEESLAVIDGVHARMARVLEAAPDAAWSRGAFHPEAGEQTLDSLVTTYSGHGAHHVEQILALRRARGW